MQWTADSLDEYVALVDAAGGPGTIECDAIWAAFDYKPIIKPNECLDPFGEAYVAEQVALHAEIAGRPYNLATDEVTSFDLPTHVTASNPCAHPHPSGLALHIERLSRAMRLADVKLTETLIDFGCGWGLSSEVASYLGLQVRAVDINPAFVALVNQRAQISGRSITASVSAFEEYKPESLGDVLLFYECFHHAVRPWVALRQAVACLRPGGKVVFAGEPINGLWWKTWGMRLDPMSIYCMRKFGWFESGWTEEFLLEVIRRTCLWPKVFKSDDLAVGTVVVAALPPFAAVEGRDIVEVANLTGCKYSDGIVRLSGKATISLKPHPRSQVIEMDVEHCKGSTHGTFSITGGNMTKRRSFGMTTLVIEDAGSAMSVSYTLKKQISGIKYGKVHALETGYVLKAIRFITVEQEITPLATPPHATPGRCRGNMPGQEASC